MKERPILFSGPMVRAILEGRKTMTRRAVKGASCSDVTRMLHPWNSDGVVRTREMCGHEAGPYFDCPYGVPGGRLWVRETHYAYGRWVVNGTTKKGHEKWEFVRVKEMPVRFETPEDPYRVSRDKEQPGKEQWYKRLGRFMPRAYARIILEITGVRVERLQEISVDDAVAEGVRGLEKMLAGGTDKLDPDSGYESGMIFSPRFCFQILWDWINANRPKLPKDVNSKRYASVKRWLDKHPPCAWDDNPWVWVVEFRRIEK